MRARDILAVLVGLAVVGGVVYGGWWWLSDALAGDDGPEVDPLAETVEAYLAAWTEADHSAMADLVRDPPEDFVEQHQAMRTVLDPSEFTVTAGNVRRPEDGRAEAPLTVSMSLEEIPGTVSWETRLDLLRERGEWRVAWSLSTIHPELRPAWTFGFETEAVGRAPILAADGTQLAGPGTRYTFGFEPAGVEDPEAVVEAFARYLPGSESVAERELRRGDLVDNWFYPVVTVSESRAEQASEILQEASGILRRTDRGRTLLDTGFARHVVGVVGEATAEELEELGAPYTAGDVIGKFGLERAFEERLVGSEIVRVGLREGEDGPLEVVIAEGQQDPSAPVETTLDVAVQRAVENALVGIDQRAAIVVVDGATGAILGSASRPLDEYNRAFQGRYPPGSTFKIVTAEALLAAGTNLDDEVTCPAEAIVGGLRVPNAGGLDLGETTFTEAFAASCNTTFARLAAELGGEELAQAAERFGFGVEPAVPLPAFGASFPSPADTAETAAAAFGQARVETSVLHLASVAAAAQSGTWRQPYLLQEEGPGESRALATGTVGVLRELLRATVTDGTGTAAAVSGQEVGGKTGTAEATGGDEHAWFAGTWGELGFAVLVEDGGSGAEVAAPLAGRLVDELSSSERSGA